MGPSVEYLAVVLGPGGVATAFATVLIAWIRSRSSAVTITLSRRDGTAMRVDVKNAKELPVDRVGELADRISAHLVAEGGAEPGSAQPGSGEPAVPQPESPAGP